MTQNPFGSYDPAIQAYLNQASSNRQYMGGFSGDSVQRAQQLAQMNANNTRVTDLQKDIEWANRQRMTDPAYWMKAFGMSGGGGQSGGDYSYQDTAGAYRTRLNSLMDNPDSISNTGAYKFAFNQGSEAVNRNLAAKGLLKSGNRLSELTKFGQGLASQQYGSEMDRLSNLVSTTRAGDIGKYSADTSRYGVEQQGRNQLAGIMMQAAMNQMNNQMDKYGPVVTEQTPGGLLTRW